MSTFRLTVAPAVVLATFGLLLAASSPAQGQAQPRAATASPGAERATARLALVIGNAAYKEGALANPVNDARAMAQALRDSGFRVLLHTDLDQRRMTQAVREFGDELRRAGGVGLFYFAGHGVQIKGRNYLVPIGADIQREDEVAYGAVDAQAVLDKMEAAGNGTNVLILDACRNNPFARSFRSSSAGLAQMDAPVGTLVAFATAPGMVASDGTGSNGLYTQNLLAAMRKPGLKVEDVFKQVRVAVRKESGGKQVPWESTSLEGDLYFAAAAAAAPAPTPAPNPAPNPAPSPPVASADDVLWSAIQSGSDPAELRAFLRRYPESRHAAQARRRLAEVASAAPPAPAVATAPVAATPAGAAPAASSTPVMPDPPPRLALEHASSRVSAAGQAKPTADPAMPDPPPRLALSAPPLRAEAAQPPGAEAQPNGYRVGDTWNFQVVDMWRKEVLRNFTIRIGQVLPGGDLLTRGGSRLDAFARAMRLEDAQGDRRREYSPHLPRGWESWQPGRRMEVRYTESMSTMAGAPLWKCDHEATVKHVGVETVRVPAGEFSARRIEIEGHCRREAPNQPKSVNSWRQVLWYVPELRYYAAMEFESRTPGGQLDTRLREELTSYSLRGAEVAQRR